jgi:hypothetical protein
MALSFYDAVKQTTETEGTADYVIGAEAVDGYRTFAASVVDGSTIGYCVKSDTDVEVGTGVYTTATGTLSRETIIASSNSDAAVVWGAGTKEIACVAPSVAYPITVATYADLPSPYTGAAMLGQRAFLLDSNAECRLLDYDTSFGSQRGWCITPQAEGLIAVLRNYSAVTLQAGVATPLQLSAVNYCEVLTVDSFSNHERIRAKDGIASTHPHPFLLNFVLRFAGVGSTDQILIETVLGGFSGSGVAYSYLTGEGEVFASVSVPFVPFDEADGIGVRLTFTGASGSVEVSPQSVFSATTQSVVYRV